MFPSLEISVGEQVFPAGIYRHGQPGEQSLYQHPINTHGTHITMDSMDGSIHCFPADQN